MKHTQIRQKSPLRVTERLESRIRESVLLQTDNVCKDYTMTQQQIVRSNWTSSSPGIVTSALIVSRLRRQIDIDVEVVVIDEQSAAVFASRSWMLGAPTKRILQLAYTLDDVIHGTIITLIDPEHVLRASALWRHRQHDAPRLVIDRSDAFKPGDVNLGLART